MDLVKMCGTSLKQRLYEDAYEKLMDQKWVGPLKLLYRIVDSLELRGSSTEYVP
jgi:hypothetical protein